MSKVISNEDYYKEHYDWVFTFLYDSPRRFNYVKIHGTWESSRKEMFRRYGTNWDFQYHSEKDAQVERYGLEEILQ